MACKIYCFFPPGGIPDPAPYFRGRQPKWEGDGRRPSSPGLSRPKDGHEAVGRGQPAFWLSSFMKYRLVSASPKRGKAARFSLAVTWTMLVWRAFSDVPSYNFTNWVRERKTMGSARAPSSFVPSIAVSPFLAAAWRATRKRRVEWRMYRSTGGMARKAGRQSA